MKTFLPFCFFALMAPVVYGGLAAHTPLNQWFKYACTAENIKLSRTYYCDNKGNIHCLPGWSDESTLCQVPVCSIQNRTCVHGKCSKPFTCECEVGWTGQFCEKCICLPGCVNGYCNRSLECICKPGWQGMLCDEPVCDNCVHGNCLPGGICACHPGWSGANCTVCEERLDCLNGRCVNEPYECACYDGYYGSSCENTICSEGCDPVNGYCNMPEMCWCNPGWTGPNCTQCVPYWNCVNGYCNKPWECICHPGFYGKDCNDTQNTNGNWGPWSNYTQCSVTCGTGTYTRKRNCDNPRKAGNGTYCSLDGSHAIDVQPCKLQDCTNSSTPINGNWGSWSNFTPCTTSCGDGTISRTRVCNNPPPSAGGSQCTGSSNDVQSCSQNSPCPINGGYTSWSSFSDCTVACIGQVGVITRTRTCTNPPPAFGGQDCFALGSDNDNAPCNGTTPGQLLDPTAPCFNSTFR